MFVHPLQRSVKAEDLSLDRLAASSHFTESAKIGEACKAFESLLLRQVLRDAQKPVFPSKYVANTVTSGIYQDLVTERLADNIARSGTFGLARSLASQMQRATALSENPSQASPASPAPSPPADHARTRALRLSKP